jgi:8-oxo-dGTP diphosphatase
MIRVVAAIIEDAGRVLICQRRGGPFALKWEFPGGKTRPSETARAALARELREELQIKARVGREIYRVRHRYAEMSTGVEIIFFTAKLLPAALPFSAPRNLVFERITWEERARLARYDFLAADLPLVRRLARGDIQLD